MRNIRYTDSVNFRVSVVLQKHSQDFGNYKHRCVFLIQKFLIQYESHSKETTLGMAKGRFEKLRIGNAVELVH